MRSTVLLSLLNPILSILLIRRFGAAGTAAGAFLAFVMATVYLLVTFHRNYVKDSVRAIFLDVYLRPIVAGLFANLAVLGFHGLAPQLVSWETMRALAPVRIAADFGIFTPVYIVLLVTFRQVTVLDWNIFKGLISLGSKFLRHPFRERIKIYR